jgi:acetoacetyl-CoA synthetase
MPLFVTPAHGAPLDEALAGKIRSRLRTERSPRHVPDEIVPAPDIPVTLSGKKMEVPIRKLLMGARLEAVASEGASRNPAALIWFADFATRKSAELLGQIGAKDGK